MNGAFFNLLWGIRFFIQKPQELTIESCGPGTRTLVCGEHRLKACPSPAERVAAPRSRIRVLGRESPQDVEKLALCVVVAVEETETAERLAPLEGSCA